MAFAAKYLTLAEIDRFYRQAEAHLEPQLLEMHLREVLAGGYANMLPEDQERAGALRKARMRLTLDWDETREQVMIRDGGGNGEHAEE